MPVARRKVWSIKESFPVWSGTVTGARSMIDGAGRSMGRRSLEAIEAVCGRDLSIDILDGLASLVDKSLVQQKETTDVEPRFTMLETIHEYAWERLEASGAAEAKSWLLHCRA